MGSGRQGGRRRGVVRGGVVVDARESGKGGGRKMKKVHIVCFQYFVRCWGTTRVHYHNLDALIVQ